MGKKQYCSPRNCSHNSLSTSRKIEGGGILFETDFSFQFQKSALVLFFSDGKTANFLDKPS